MHSNWCLLAAQVSSVYYFGWCLVIANGVDCECSWQHTTGLYLFLLFPQCPCLQFLQSLALHGHAEMHWVCTTIHSSVHAYATSLPPPPPLTSMVFSQLLTMVLDVLWRYFRASSCAFCCSASWSTHDRLAWIRSHSSAGTTATWRGEILGYDCIHYP